MNQRAQFMRHDPKWTHITGVTILGESRSGEAIQIEKNERLMWLPLSQVHHMKRSGHVGGDEITITEWIARKVGLIE